MPKTLAEEIYEQCGRHPNEPPWPELRASEQQHWIKLADLTYRRVMEQFGIPPLKNGMPRVDWDPDGQSDQRFSVLVTEDDPVLLMAVDSGLELRPDSL